MLRALFLTYFVLAICGCAITQKTAYPGIANRGIVSLSTFDPNFATNQLISRELEDGGYLARFFSEKGAPLAIEIIEGSDRPVRLVMFYPEKKAVYAADLMIGQKKGTRDWLIRGPFPMGESDYSEIVRMPSSLLGTPVFRVQGKEVRF